MPNWIPVPFTPPPFEEYEVNEWLKNITDFTSMLKMEDSLLYRWSDVREIWEVVRSYKYDSGVYYVYDEDATEWVAQPIFKVVSGGAMDQIHVYDTTTTTWHPIPNMTIDTTPAQDLISRYDDQTNEWLVQPTLKVTDAGARDQINFYDTQAAEWIGWPMYKIDTTEAVDVISRYDDQQNAWYVQPTFKVEDAGARDQISFYDTQQNEWVPLPYFKRDTHEARDIVMRYDEQQNVWYEQPTLRVEDGGAQDTVYIYDTQTNEWFLQPTLQTNGSVTFQYDFARGKWLGDLESYHFSRSGTVTTGQELYKAGGTGTGPYAGVLMPWNCTIVAYSYTVDAADSGTLAIQRANTSSQTDLIDVSYSGSRYGYLDSANTDFAKNGWLCVENQGATVVHPEITVWLRRELE